MVQFHLLPSTPPPPAGIPQGICHFFMTGRSSPHRRARRKRQFATPGTLHWSHTALTHKRETTPLFVYKIKITIFISVQNHTINIPETHAVDNTSTPKPMFHYNSRFFRLVQSISYSYQFRTLPLTSLVRCLRHVKFTLFYQINLILYTALMFQF